MARKYSVFGATNRGSRAINQDVIGINDTIMQDCCSDISTCSRKYTGDDSQLQLFAVADGVGGSVRGEIASRAAIKAANDWYRAHSDNEEISEGQIFEAFTHFNEYVLQVAEEEGVRTATTLTVLLILNDKFMLCNVGDTPAYILRKHRMVPIYEKQTFAEIIRKETGKEPDPEHKNMLVSFLGDPESNAGEEVHVTTGEMKDHDIFLIASDGVVNEVSTLTLMRLMLAGENYSSRLVRKMNKHKDNSTFLRIEVNHIK